MSKTLVAYFSATGVTGKVAGKLAEAAGADLFEIRPETPYTRADLDWTDKNSRSTVEMADRACRPAMACQVEEPEKYDTVFVGFPIWWYREPSIVDTFMESFDFAGKTVIPFATSGSSGMGDSADNLQALAKDAKVLPGKRFPAGVTKEELASWVSSLC